MGNGTLKAQGCIACWKMLFTEARRAVAPPPALPGFTLPATPHFADVAEVLGTGAGARWTPAKPLAAAPVRAAADVAGAGDMAFLAGAGADLAAAYLGDVDDDEAASEYETT